MIWEELGVVAILGVVIWYLFRQSRQDRKFMEDRIAKIADEYNRVCTDLVEAEKKNTQVLSELITWLRARNGVRR